MRRCQIDPPLTDMSISACPSIRPAMPRSACRLASATISGRKKSRKSTTSKATMTGAPTASANMNCQPMSTTRMVLSSLTRFVDAIWNAIAAVKLAPLRKTDRARATAA